MGNTLIGLTSVGASANLVEAATLKNGTGGGAPALAEISPYAMSNALTSDRYTLWKGPGGLGTVEYDLAFSGNKTVTAVAILGLRLAAGSSITGLNVYSAASASGYPPGAWTLQSALSGPIVAPSVRDIGAVIASVSHRYWRFEFVNPSDFFTVGHLWVGNPTDLGYVHGPGGIYAPFRNRLETPMPSGAVVLADLGDPGADFTLPWPSVQTALRTKLLTMQAAAGSFLLVDADGNFFEVYAKGGRVQTQRDFSTLFSANIELSRMP
jgi:hypothetical protein